MALQVKKRYPVPKKSRAHHTLPQRTLKREQRRASARRTMTALLALGLVMLIGGVGYTWYMGKQEPVALEQTAMPTPKRTVLRPPKIASNAAIGASVQSYTPEVKPGENASVTIRTNPEAECVIAVKYNKVLAVDSGLTPKVADEFGVASWSWTVALGTPPGAWPAEVTCKNKKNSAFVKAEFIVK
ncbi:MAG: hypothetical protein V4678_00840 [Patescibacteria group bacterium]